MKGTSPLLRLASTQNGMRRILKRPIPTLQYIRQAVQAGVYLAPDEDPMTTDLEKRNKTQQLPIDYHILALNPPIPLPPRIPKKILKQMEIQGRRKTGTDRLVQSYLQKRNAVYGDINAQTTDDYYRRLLGIAAPEPSSIMGQKSSVVNKAYAVAMKQQELMRSSNGGGGMTQDESLAMVEELLAAEQKEERHSSRKVQQQVTEWNHQQTETTSRATVDSTDSTTDDSTTTTTDNEDPINDSTTTDNNDNNSSSIPSILHSKPRAIAGMSLWSKRLQAVPYREWTIGASTALDHFVARSILDITENTWETILEGRDASLQSIGQDIVLTRRSLFPETAMAEMEDEELMMMEEEELGDHDGNNEKKSYKSVADKSIDELLAQLGGFNDDDDENNIDDWERDTSLPTGTNNNYGDDIDFDSKVARLSDELQDWRRKEHSYDQWSNDDKAQFDAWLKDYVATLQPDDDESSVDWDETREALLAVPPMSRDESNHFWNSIRDETEAELFLQSIIDDNDNDDDNSVIDKSAPFWTLDYQTQVQQLAVVGSSLRPLLDENVPHKTKMAFMERHSEKLLEGLELEHLVRDDQHGSISGVDVQKWTDGEGVSDKDRFSIQTLPYGTNEKALALFQEWNRQKAGRAKHEEYLFRSGKLGLRYSDPIVDENDDDE